MRTCAEIHNYIIYTKRSQKFLREINLHSQADDCNSLIRKLEIEYDEASLAEYRNSKQYVSIVISQQVNGLNKKNNCT